MSTWCGCPPTLTLLYTASALVRCDLVTPADMQPLPWWLRLRHSWISAVTQHELCGKERCPQAVVWLLPHLLRGDSCSPAIKSGRGARRGDSAGTSRLFRSPPCASRSCSVTMTEAKFGWVRTERARDLLLLLQLGTRGRAVIAPKCGSRRRHEVAHNAAPPLPGLCRSPAQRGFQPFPWAGSSPPATSLALLLSR